MAAKKKSKPLATVGPDRLHDWVMRVHELLQKEYGRRRHRRQSGLDCLVLTVLSQNTNDVNRDRAWDEMTRRFPTWQDVLKADRGELAESIRVAGLANTRAKNIQGILAEVKDRFGDFTIEPLKDQPPVEVERRLTELPGVGIKTVKCVELFAFRNGAFPVDTHIRRIAGRIGWVPEGTTLEKVTRALEGIVPPKDSLTLHINLITLGREICTARKALCDRCPLVEECEMGKKGT